MHPKPEAIFKKTTFMLSVANLAQLPKDEGHEIAFVGRSNVGKSSVLNVITGIKGLARTSKTPGRTQLMNFFAIDDHHRLVDLPGYGYAKVPLPVKQQWQKLLAEYLEVRRSLSGFVLIIDIRHPDKEFDQMMLQLAADSEIPVHVLLNKADKLTPSKARQALIQFKSNLKTKFPNATVQLFSAHVKSGVEEAQAQLLAWLQLI